MAVVHAKRSPNAGDFCIDPFAGVRVVSSETQNVNRSVRELGLAQGHGISIYREEISVSGLT